jgi:hypothetical protein
MIVTGNRDRQPEIQGHDGDIKCHADQDLNYA